MVPSPCDYDVDYRSVFDLVDNDVDYRGAFGLVDKEG
jgi:hypothetical protein